MTEMGERVARRDGATDTGGVFYYFSDHLKTASVITDASGNIKSEFDFYPWGGELQFVANDSNHYKFTSKERDAETGLDYFGARYFSNGLGRFTTPDWAAKATAVPYAEFSDPQSLNLYSYVRNVPTSKADPDGHCPWCNRTETSPPMARSTGTCRLAWSRKPISPARSNPNMYSSMVNGWLAATAQPALTASSITSLTI
jgi:RHS repeat-associated protein